MTPTRYKTAKIGTIEHTPGKYKTKNTTGFNVSLYCVFDLKLIDKIRYKNNIVSKTYIVFSLIGKGGSSYTRHFNNILMYCKNITFRTALSTQIETPLYVKSLMFHVSLGINEDSCSRCIHILNLHKVLNNPCGAYLR